VNGGQCAPSRTSEGDCQHCRIPALCLDSNGLKPKPAGCFKPTPDEPAMHEKLSPVEA